MQLEIVETNFRVVGLFGSNGLLECLTNKLETLIQFPALRYHRIDDASVPKIVGQNKFGKLKPE